MNYRRIITTIVGILLVSLLLHLILDWTRFGLETVSNSLFVVSILSFLMALIFQTGAYQVFYGFRYSFRILVSRQFHKEYPKYSTYRDEQLEKGKTPGSLEFLIGSFLVLVVAIVLGYLA